MEKGKIIVTSPFQASVLQPKIQRQKKVVTGREKFGWGCVSFLVFIFVVPFYFSAGEQMGLISCGLLATLLLMGFSMMVHGRESGKIIEKQEYKLGTGIGLLVASITFFSMTFADFNEGYRAWFLILGLLILTIGVSVLIDVWKKIK